MIRVFVAVTDTSQRIALRRALRGNRDIRLVSKIADADVVVRESGRTELAMAVQHAQRDDSAYSSPKASTGDALTAREREVLQLLAAGQSNAQIAAHLSISTSTVKYHLVAVFAKLGVHTRTEAVAIGLRRGVVLL